MELQIWTPACVGPFKLVEAVTSQAVSDKLWYKLQSMRWNTT